MILFPSNSLKTPYLRVMIVFSPETYPCWSCFSLWPHFVSLRSNRDLPMLKLFPLWPNFVSLRSNRDLAVLKLFIPLAMLCLSLFKCRLTRAEAGFPSGYTLSLSVQTETYPCWSCFSLWQCSVSLHSNRDSPMLKLFLPLTMLCLSPFKKRLTHAEAVSPSGHALSLSIQTETYLYWSCFSLRPCFFSLCLSRDLSVLKLFLPLAMLCLSPFKQRLTCAEAVSPSGHSLPLSVQTETYLCWSWFSLWPHFVSFHPNRDLPILKLFLPLATLCLFLFKQRLTHAEAVSPSGHALSHSIQTETYPCWSCFSLWPRFVSLRSNRDLPMLKLFSPSGHALSHSIQTETYPFWSCFSLWPRFVSLCSNRDLPMLKLFLPLATLCLSPFKQRLTRAEAVSPSGHALSLSVQAETFSCWSCFSLWPCFVSLSSSRNFPMLKLFLPLATLCLSQFKQKLSHDEAVSPSGHALSLSIQAQLSIMLSSCCHRFCHKGVRSVVWHREDSSGDVVTISNVTEDGVGDNYFVSIELNISHHSSTECDICWQIILDYSGLSIM